MGANIFNSVRLSKVDSNSFDLSHDVKLSFNMGELVPVSWMDVLPGDKISQSSESLLRMAPMLAPVMHKVDVTVHTFFVPNRILWPNWEKFITGGGSDGSPPGTTPAFPYLEVGTVVKGSMSDYLGYPIGTAGKRSVLPYYAYNMIWNEYYRDQNLMPRETDVAIDGDNISIFPGTAGAIKKRSWQHDYFTASLPFAQKGTAVDVPIAGNVGLKAPDVNQRQWMVDPASHTVMGPIAEIGTNITGQLVVPAGGAPTLLDPNGTMEVTNSTTTINDLRAAFRLQEWLEKNARAGSRYIESILAHFGVKSSDARLNRPEYLGGSKNPMIISEVLQTSETVSSPQGNMAGHGISVGGGNGFSYTAEEHGIMMTIMSVLPKTAYQQGVHRSWTKFDKLDYAWPEFAHLGEQEVLSKELYWNAADGVANEAVFGYVPRYAEYKYLDSRVAGDFRDNLSYWHMGRIFSSRPALNQAFVEADPTHRVFAVTDPNEDKIYAHVFHKINARRKLPKYGTPTF